MIDICHAHLRQLPIQKAYSTENILTENLKEPTQN